MPFVPQQAPPSMDTDGLRKHGEEQFREVARAWTEVEASIASLNASLAAVIAGLPASYVTSIAALSGAFTLNGTSGITNLVNDIRLSQASASQFGAMKVDGTTLVATAGVVSTNVPKITASLGADVALNNVANYFDGPSVAQGTSGVWFVSGTVTVFDSGNANIFSKLWDGTTVIASAVASVSANFRAAVSLAGFITSPAGNLRISCRDATTVGGKIEFNASGNSKDSTISAIRIA
jgi:hypothetical protein